MTFNLRKLLIYEMKKYPTHIQTTLEACVVTVKMHIDTVLKLIKFKCPYLPQLPLQYKGFHVQELFDLECIL